MVGNQSIKQQIVANIASTDDAHMKTVLLLMLGILEEIGGKIDAVLADEKSLRETVLNGHALVHDDDHEWIKVQRAKEAEASQSSRKIRDGLIEKILWAALAAAIAWMVK